MGYFNFLPNIIYRDDNRNNIIAKNIITRAKILDILKESQSGSVVYRIRDEERPETIAQRVYGRADYHWLILMFNEILDPYFSWPMSMNEMEYHMKNVYSGEALFIYPNMLYDEDVKAKFDRRIPHFEVGDYIEQRYRGNILATGKVKSWNPDLYKVVVETLTGKFSLVGEAAASESNAIGDPEDLSLDIRTTNRNGKTISAPMIRYVSDNQFALHHFQKEDSGELISSHYSPSNGGPWSLIDRYVLGKQEYIDLGPDRAGDQLGYVSIVTNMKYEEDVNDAKRNIRVMRPEYIDPVLKDFRKLFQTVS